MSWAAVGVAEAQKADIDCRGGANRALSTKPARIPVPKPSMFQPVKTSRRVFINQMINLLSTFTPVAEVRRSFIEALYIGRNEYIQFDI